MLSSSREQGNFRGPKASRPRPRTWGFEAKAKDFKMCPRARLLSQGRPRGLHLWLLITAYRNMFGIFSSYLLTLRPGSHDQIFCTIFWHQSYERSCKSMTHYCGHLSSITLNSPCEKENQTLESFADFLRRNTTELYFPSKFSKGRRFQRKKLSF